ncbi:endonuclease domain-containing protein [Mesorhizobium sp. CCNWLW179-1]|uniref:endonuclease domain-containing protein n=2 Tax=Mesorhizobium TaxID=68287 RepID=UPI003212569D
MSARWIFASRRNSWPSPHGFGMACGQGTAMMIEAWKVSPPPCGEGLGVGVLLMPTGIGPDAIRRARRLRRNMTEGERKLWLELREFRRLYGIHVRRQAPLGPYIADFVIHERHLIIEVDGEHHFTATGHARDRKRDEWLASQGYKTLRFNTGELSESFDGCVEEILRELGLMPDLEITPTPSPSPQGGGGLC